MALGWAITTWYLNTFTIYFLDMRRNRFYAIVKKGGFYNVTYGTVPHPYMRY